jgi:hypothetical protein
VVKNCQCKNEIQLQDCDEKLDVGKGAVVATQSSVCNTQMQECFHQALFKGKNSQRPLANGWWLWIQAMGCTTGKFHLERYGSFAPQGSSTWKVARVKNKEMEKARWLAWN